MTAPPKYWQRADLGQLAEDLRECDEIPLGVLGALWRLLDEVDRLNYEVAELNAMRR